MIFLDKKKLDKREEELSLKLSNRQKKNRHQDIKVKLLLNSPLAPQFSKKKKGFSWQIEIIATMKKKSIMMMSHFFENE